MTTPLFYGKPVPLSSRTHLNLRIKPSDDGLRFTSKANSVLLAGVEFPEACKHFPIVFAKGARSQVLPIALLGFREHENLFVDANGRWQGEYVPAYIRRYPFVLAQAVPGQDMTVCIDETYPGFGADEGRPLFNAKGEATEHLKSVLAFLQDYQVQYQRTERFAQSLVEANLLMDISASVNLAGGEKYALRGFQMVDERKLLALPDDKVLRLFRAGELSWVYSHLISIGNFARLPAKARAAQSPRAAAEKSTPPPAEKSTASPTKPPARKK